jgi:hypothetical protein
MRRRLCSKLWQWNWYLRPEKWTFRCFSRWPGFTCSGELRGCSGGHWCSKAHMDLGLWDVKPRKHADETEKERWSLILMHVKRLGEFHARRMSWRIIYGRRRMLHTHAFFPLPHTTPCIITVLPNTHNYGSANENGLYLSIYLPMISVLLPITPPPLLQQTALQPSLFIEQDYNIFSLSYLY